MIFIFLSLLRLILPKTHNALPEVQIIDGYTNHLSLFPGDSVDVFLNATRSYGNLPLKLYDVNGIEVAQWTIQVFSQEVQEARAYERGYAYKLTKRIKMPMLESGVYLFDKKIPVVLKSRNPKIVVLYPSNTANAYCPAGGKSLYGFNSTDQFGATKISFRRPIQLPQHAEAFFRWLKLQNLEDVGFITDADLDYYGSIKKAKLLIVTGHSEYWTLEARKNFDRFVGEGNDAMILSGNTMWWQVRYSSDRSQLICYRNVRLDPVKSTKLKTINWHELSLNYPIIASTGTDFRYGGYGLKSDNGWDGYRIVRNSPLLTGTTLHTGDVLSCQSDELDGAPLRGLINGVPLLDSAALGFERAEIIGYDLVSRTGQGVATWIVFQRTKSSGVVINTASTDWCSARGIGSNKDIQTITGTMIQKLLNNENVFSAPSDQMETDLQ